VELSRRLRDLVERLLLGESLKDRSWPGALGDQRQLSGSEIQWLLCFQMNANRISGTSMLDSFKASLVLVMTRKQSYGFPPHGMTGTVEMLFAGAPSINLRLMAR